jgi:hypothetical protein
MKLTKTLKAAQKQLIAGIGALLLEMNGTRKQLYGMGCWLPVHLT